MTTSHNILKAHRSDLPAIDPPHNRWEGRLFGGLILAAFLLYGVGSALDNETIGLTLVAANSVAVSVVGIIGLRLLRDHSRTVGVVYLTSRIAEAILLGGGFALYAIADISGADNTGYLLGMTALGLGSLPFWWAVGRGASLSKRFALWGVGGYAVLAAGALIELTTGRAVTVAAAIPGGLFEIAVGVYLLRRGFRSGRGGSDASNKLAGPLVVGAALPGDLGTAEIAGDHVAAELAP